MLTFLKVHGFKCKEMILYFFWEILRKTRENSTFEDN